MLLLGTLGSTLKTRLPQRPSQGAKKGIPRRKSPESWHGDLFSVCFCFYGPEGAQGARWPVSSRQMSFILFLEPMCVLMFLEPIWPPIGIDLLQNCYLRSRGTLLGGHNFAFLFELELIDTGQRPQHL